MAGLPKNSPRRGASIIRTMISIRMTLPRETIGIGLGIGIGIGIEVGVGIGIGSGVVIGVVIGLELGFVLGFIGGNIEVTRASYTT